MNAIEQAIRELHSESYRTYKAEGYAEPITVCQHCGEEGEYYYEPYPCPTIRAIEEVTR